MAGTEQVFSRWPLLPAVLTLSFLQPVSSVVSAALHLQEAEFSDALPEITPLIEFTTASTAPGELKRDSTCPHLS